MRGAISKKRGSQPRWPQKRKVWRRLNGHESESWTQAKTDLKPPLRYLGGQGCPSRGGIRRACGEVPGRNRWETGALIHPPHQGDCGRHGTEEQGVTSGELGGTGVSKPISAKRSGERRSVSSRTAASQGEVDSSFHGSGTGTHQTDDTSANRGTDCGAWYLGLTDDFGKMMSASSFSARSSAMILKEPFACALSNAKRNW